MAGENMPPPPDSPTGSHAISFDKIRLPGNTVNTAETITTTAMQSRRTHDLRHTVTHIWLPWMDDCRWSVTDPSATFYTRPAACSPPGMA